jgi:RNA polymerase sigma-70 factor (ECF subfamily)
LLRKVRAGDRNAAGTLVKTHYGSVYRFLWHLCGNTHEAEDLTQETFAAAWKSLDGFAGRASIKTWLHRIAYRKFVDRGRRQVLDSEAMAVLKRERSVRAGEEGAPGAALLGERQKVIRAAIRRLREEDRALIALHYLEGMSLRETAEAAGRPVGTVKWRTHRALAKLKGLLNGKV